MERGQVYIVYTSGSGLLADLRYSQSKSAEDIIIMHLCDFLSENLYLLFFLHIIKDIGTSGVFVLKLTQLLHCIHVVQAGVHVLNANIMKNLDYIPSPSYCTPP